MFIKIFGVLSVLVAASSTTVITMELADASRSRGGIYWYGICTNSLVDVLIKEPCDTLVTDGGYELTPEGERVLFCVVGGALLYLVDPEAGEAARQIGPSVGCG